MTSRTLRILNTIDDCPFPEVFDPLKEAGELLHLATGTQSEYEGIVSTCDAVVTSLRVKTTREVFDIAKRLKVLASPSTGLDHIDLVEASERGVAVLSLKNDTEFLGQLTATAELAWALLLSTVRRIPWAFAAAREGNWARDGFRGTQISGKTLGIVGLGRLGRIVASYGQAFRLQVLATDPRDDAAMPGVERVSLEELVERSDIVSIHIHLTEENRNLFSREIIGRMKPGAILINTSRGAVVDEEALLEALESRRLAGAGVDVIDGEWRDDLDHHPMIVYSRSHDNLVITPHIGGVTHESQRMALERTVGKLIDYLKTIPESQGAQ